METTPTAAELERIETLPLDERADALEALERALRRALDEDVSGS